MYRRYPRYDYNYIPTSFRSFTQHLVDHDQPRFPFLSARLRKRHCLRQSSRPGRVRQGSRRGKIHKVRAGKGHSLTEPNRDEGLCRQLSKCSPRSQSDLPARAPVRYTSICPPRSSSVRDGEDCVWRVHPRSRVALQQVSLAPSTFFHRHSSTATDVAHDPVQNLRSEGPTILVQTTAATYSSLRCPRETIWLMRVPVHPLVIFDWSSRDPTLIDDLPAASVTTSWHFHTEELQRAPLLSSCGNEHMLHYGLVEAGGGRKETANGR
ncbi:hypothetical protein C8Q80DRAFT_462907 [Daedaleopsis nitida]|nr:hypothetical protein C8Q80DRAFT_462907 [Daedaleopsis nitida]